MNCKHCKHWQDGDVLGEWGTCVKISDYDLQAIERTNPRTEQLANYQKIETHMEFGCVKFESDIPTGDGIEAPQVENYAGKGLMELIEENPELINNYSTLEEIQGGLEKCISSIIRHGKYGTTVPPPCGDCSKQEAMCRSPFCQKYAGKGKLGDNQLRKWWDSLSEDTKSEYAEKHLDPLSTVDLPAIAYIWAREVGS